MTNEEIRSYTEIEQELRRALADNTMLRTQVAQMRQTIAEYERADAVAEAMAANNDVLRSLESSTYQVQGKVVEVDVELARFMYERGNLMHLITQWGLCPKPKRVTDCHQSMERTASKIGAIVLWRCRV